MAYRVLLAAEKEMEREIWKQELSKHRNLFSTVEVCTGGKQLLSAAEGDVPDIILASSGIKDVSVISAMEILRQRMGQRFRLVGVCEEGEFAFAKACVHLRADALLVRPFSPQVLVQTLGNVAQELPVIPAEDTGMGYKRIIGRLFRDRIHRMPAGQYLPEDLVNSAYATEFQPGAYRVIILCIDVAQEMELQNGFALIEDQLGKLFACLEVVCWETLPLMSTALQRQWLLNYSEQEDGHVLYMLNGTAEYLANCLPESIRVSFCCSDRCADMKDLRSKLNEASEVKWSRFLRREPFLLPAMELPVSTAAEQLCQSLEKQMIRACTTLDSTLFQNALTQLFAMPDAVVGHSRTRTLIRRVESCMFETNRELIASFASVEHLAQQMESALQKASTLEDYKKRYKAHMVSLLGKVQDVVKSQSTKPVYLARGYIRNHYSETIRLEHVAEHVGLNSTYLSYLFKKETGMGIPDYVNQIRIEEAKHLLETTELKILSIAQMVGFSDPRYFSRVFHIREGCRPKDYRTARQRIAKSGVYLP